MDVQQPSADLNWEQHVNSTDRDLINKIGRTVLKNAFRVSEIREIASLPPVSKERLALFDEDQMTFGPHRSEICLDTSPPTAIAMKECAWNNAIVELLVIQADDLVNGSLGLSDRLSDSVDWEKLFSSRLYDIFLDTQRERSGTPDLPAQTSVRYEDKKDRNKKRRELRQKFMNRQQISSIMARHSESIGNDEALSFWTAALSVVNLLQADGMSDEETAYEGEEQVKVVKQPAFRHPGLASLFRHVDSAPKEMKSLFDQGGRKRLRRVFSSEISQRRPPPNLPITFYRSEYLDLMRKGLVPWVEVQENATISIPEVNFPDESKATFTTNQSEPHTESESESGFQSHSAVAHAKFKPQTGSEHQSEPRHTEPESEPGIPVAHAKFKFQTESELGFDRHPIVSGTTHFAGPRNLSTYLPTMSEDFVILVVEWVVVGLIFYGSLSCIGFILYN
ncbi:hypothetical protein VKT23_013677 [Stygiomarasmius scandens]|uniref:Uncharacterized protein n=1 Tax=Marasmiellus scandens TaxID=2682957 RepID=A0ABR1J3G5_9AGAR